MQRITITIDEQLAQEIDKLAEVSGYQNRSEAVRDLVRAGITHTHTEAMSSHCVATVVYIYDQGTRELPKRLARAFQDEHDLSVATMRIALDHGNCMEVAVLKGKTADVKEFAGQVVAERGVKHGRVVLIPADIRTEKHAHADRRAHVHQHIRVR
jgi:CopG family nickel-responsive transcriptional regulator